VSKSRKTPTYEQTPPPGWASTAPPWPPPIVEPDGRGHPPLFQYMDVVTDIWANLRENVNDVQLEVRREISNLDVGAGLENSNLPAVIRSIKINGTTLLVVGKPMLIGSVDDLNSNRQFQLEVTATKLR
jgi:hypothetical protein